MPVAVSQVLALWRIVALASIGESVGGRGRLGATARVRRSQAVADGLAYQATRVAVGLARNPEALVSALTRLAADPRSVPGTATTEHLWAEPPVFARSPDWHPSVDVHLRQLSHRALPDRIRAVAARYRIEVPPPSSTAAVFVVPDITPIMEPAMEHWSWISEQKRA